MSQPTTHLTRHARLYAATVGVVVFVLGANGTLALLSEIQLQQVASAQARLVERIDQVTGEAFSLLDRLNASYAADCTPRALVRLRNLTFDTRFVRDIGLLDEQGAVFCSTGTGRWEPPFQPGTDQMHARQLPGGVTRYTMFDTPSRIGAGRQRTTIIWQGRFNLVIDPFALTDLYQKRTQSIWFRAAAHEVLHVGPAHPQLRKSLHDLLHRDARSAQTRQPQGYFSWREQAFVRTDVAPNSQLIVQTHVALPDALHDQAPTLLMLLGFAGLLGMLSAVVTRQRLRHLGTLDARIGQLLGAAHLRCVYQPIVDIHTGAPVGCEVLMRIEDGGELLMPEVAIPAIMRKGLTWELDRAVML